MTSESEKLWIMCGRVLATFGPLLGSDFERGKVWHEYYNPAELETLKQFGATERWIDQFLMRAIEWSDVWYTLIGRSNAPLTELTAVHVELLFGDRVSLPGYLNLVAGEVTSGCLFDPDLLLSTHPDYAEENRSALDAVSASFGLPQGASLPILVEARAIVDLSNFRIPRELEIPIEG